MAGDELTRAAGRLVLSDDEDPPNMRGPIMSPVDRFMHLSEGTRRWIEGLREEDISRFRQVAKFDDDDWTQIRAAIEFQRSARTIGRFGKWIVITAASTFIGAVAFGEKVVVFWKWFMGAPK